MAGEKRYLGVGVESAFGTAVAAQAFMDFTRAELDVPDSPQIVYPGSAGGRMPALMEEGPYVPNGAIEVGVDPSNFGYLLRAFFGSYADSGDDPYTHTFEVADVETLPSVTLRIGRGIFEHRFPGATGNRLSLTAEHTGDRAFLMATAEFFTAQDVRATIDSDPKTLPSAYYTARDGAVALAGGSISADLEMLRVELLNNITPDTGVRFASRYAVELPIGAIDVSGELRLSFGDQDEYDRFVGTNPVNVVALFTRGSTTFQIRIPAARWTRVQAPVIGRDRITQTVSFTGLLDDSLGTSLQIIVVNSVEDYDAA